MTEVSTEESAGHGIHGAFLKDWILATVLGRLEPKKKKKEEEENKKRSSRLLQEKSLPSIANGISQSVGLQQSSLGGGGREHAVLRMRWMTIQKTLFALLSARFHCDMCLSCQKAKAVPNRRRFPPLRCVGIVATTPETAASWEWMIDDF